MLSLHKSYSILSSTSITKKLTQQYIGPFRLLKKVSQLVYRLDVPLDWRVHPIFLVAQLEPALSQTNDLFHRLCHHIPPVVFVNDDTNAIKSFKIDRLLNKRIVRKGKGHAVEYLVCWTGYGPE